MCLARKLIAACARAQYCLRLTRCARVTKVTHWFAANCARLTQPRRVSLIKPAVCEESSERPAQTCAHIKRCRTAPAPDRCQSPSHLFCDRCRRQVHSFRRPGTREVRSSGRTERRKIFISPVQQLPRYYSACSKSISRRGILVLCRSSGRWLVFRDPLVSDSNKRRTIGRRYRCCRRHQRAFHERTRPQ